MIHLRDGWQRCRDTQQRPVCPDDARNNLVCCCVVPDGAFVVRVQPRISRAPPRCAVNQNVSPVSMPSTTHSSSMTGRGTGRVAATSPDRDRRCHSRDETLAIGRDQGDVQGRIAGARHAEIEHTGDVAATLVVENVIGRQVGVDQRRLEVEEACSSSSMLPTSDSTHCTWCGSSSGYTFSRTLSRRSTMRSRVAGATVGGHFPSRFGERRRVQARDRNAPSSSAMRCCVSSSMRRSVFEQEGSPAQQG